jgi:ribosomal protein L5
MKTIKKINKQLILNRFAEYNKYTQVIQLVTLFPYQNIMDKGTFFHAILNFSFKEISFNKKRVLPFFLALELLTNQKCVATISTKDIFV